MNRNRTIDVPGAHGPAPEFIVTPETLDAVSLPGDRGGMILGSGPDGQPVAVSLLRPAPTRIVSVGGLYFARQLALRALATGAWVIIATARPAAWKMLEHTAGQTPDGKPAPLFQIRRLTHFPLPQFDEDTPLLVIHDGGAVPQQELFPPRAAWQTTMYVLPYLHPQVASTPAANAADLVLLQRLQLSGANHAQRIWSLQPQQAQQLTQLKDDQVIVLGNWTWTRVQLITSPKEQEILGPIRRGD